MTADSHYIIKWLTTALMKISVDAHLFDPLLVCCAFLMPAIDNARVSVSFVFEVSANLISDIVNTWSL